LEQKKDGDKKYPGRQRKAAEARLQPARGTPGGRTRRLEGLGCCLGRDLSILPCRIAGSEIMIPARSHETAGEWTIDTVAGYPRN
jgi:hypothetical protein